MPSSCDPMETVLPVRITSEMADVLKQIGAHTGSTVSTVIRIALRKGAQAACDALCVANDRPLLTLRLETLNQQKPCPTPNPCPKQQKPRPPKIRPGK